MQVDSLLTPEADRWALLAQGYSPCRGELARPHRRHL